MPNPLNNVVCLDAYPPGAGDTGATIRDVYNAHGGWYMVANASVYYQLQWGGLGQDTWTDETAMAPGSGLIGDGATGIRFRNFTAGTPARVSGYLNPSAIPGVQLVAIFPKTLNPDGTVT